MALASCPPSFREEYVLSVSELKSKSESDVKGRHSSSMAVLPGSYGAVERDEPCRKPELKKQLLATLAIIGLGALVVAALVGFVIRGDRQGQVELAQRQGRARSLSARPARLQQLWFGPGITDELNRYVRIGAAFVDALFNPCVERLHHVPSLFDLPFSCKLIFLRYPIALRKPIFHSLSTDALTTQACWGKLQARAGIAFRN